MKGRFVKLCGRCGGSGIVVAGPKASWCRTCDGSGWRDIESNGSVPVHTFMRAVVGRRAWSQPSGEFCLTNEIGAVVAHGRVSGASGRLRDAVLTLMGDI